MYESKNPKINKILQKLEEKEVDELINHIVNEVLQYLVVKSKNPLVV